jgi:hypothetical protein
MSEEGWIKGIGGAARYCDVSTRLIQYWVQKGYVNPKRLSKRLLMFKGSELNEAITKMAKEYDASQKGGLK